MARALRLFYSYAREDERYRKKLETHLSTLRHQGIIQEWHDQKIIPGEQWQQETYQQLQQADLILLLISADFLSSDVCHNQEMERALQRHHKRQARVIPVHIRSVDWEGSPFAELQPLPTDARPVSAWDNEDEAFTDIARGIRRAAAQLRGIPITLRRLLPSVPTRVHTQIWKITAVIALLILATGSGLVYQDYSNISQHLQNGKRYLDLYELGQARNEYQQALANSWFFRDNARLGLLKAEVFDLVDNEFNNQIVEQRIATIQQQRPDDAHAYMFRGILHAAQNQYKKAETHYLKALELDPDIPYVYHGLGIVYDQTARPDEALEMHRNAVAKAPSHQDYLINLADQYVRRGDHGSAVETYTEALNKGGGDYVLAYLEFARYYRFQQQPGNAQYYHEQAVELINDDAIAARPKNSKSWYFAIDDKQIFLDNLEHKRCYASLSLVSLYRQLVLAEKISPQLQTACDNEAIKAWVNFETKRYSG